MSVTIKVNVDEAIHAAADLDGTAEQFTSGAARALNTVAARTRDESVRRVVSQVRLPEEYVDARVSVSQEATESNLKAVISAPMRGTRLDRYGAKQRVVSNVWTKAKYVAKFGSEFARVPLPGKSKLMPWLERKGDELRGIQKGQKAAGVRVAIKAGGNVKALPHAFFVPFRAGKESGGNGMGVLLRGKDGRIRPGYGPSVDQVVRGVWRDIEGAVAGELESEILAEVTAEIERKFEK